MDICCDFVFFGVCVWVDLKVGYCPNTAFSFTFLFIIIFTSSHIWNKESTTWLNYNEIEMLFLCQRAFTSWLPNQKGKTSFFSCDYVRDTNDARISFSPPAASCQQTEVLEKCISQCDFMKFLLTEKANFFFV